MKKAFRFLVFFFLSFVCFFSLSAQDNVIVNRSSFVGFYDHSDSGDIIIGRIEDNKIQFYIFNDRGEWQKYGQQEFALPNGWTKTFFVGYLIGVVVPNSSGINTVQFYAPQFGRGVSGIAFWEREPILDFILPTASIDVIGHANTYIDYSYYAPMKFWSTTISVIDRERIRGYSFSDDTGWESFIIDDWWDDEYKLPRGISYVVGTSNSNDFGYMTVTNNKIQFYAGTGQGLARFHYEFLLPDGYGDVFANGGIIAVSVNSEITFYDVNIAYGGRSERLYYMDF
jgi:hypothetical protein